MGLFLHGSSTKSVESMSGPEKKGDSIDVVRRYACILNNVGGLLLQRGAFTPAMTIFQECVQWMMQAEDEINQTEEDHISQWLKHDIMETHLKQLLHDPYITTLPSHLDTRDAMAPSMETKGSADKSSGRFKSQNPTVEESSGNPIGEREGLQYSGIPGLFLSSGNSQHPKTSPGICDATSLAFPDPFYVALKGSHQPWQKPDTLRIGFEQCSEGTLFNMALIHFAWGNIAAAIQFFELSISLAPSVSVNSPIPLNPVILACLNNLGQIHCMRGRTTEARGLVSDALTRGSVGLTHFYNQIDMKVSSQGSDQETSLFVKESGIHRCLARTLMNMGGIHFRLCDYDSAMTSCTDARRLLHPNMSDVDASSLYYNMAILHQHRHERQQALTHYENFLRIANNIVGPNHPQVATALHSMGAIYYEMGQLHEALRPLLRSLAIRQMKCLPMHPCIAESLHLCGNVLHDREEYGDAMDAYRQALVVHRAASGEKATLEIAEIQMDVGRILHSQDLLTESLVAYSEVLEISQRVFGRRHAYVARIFNIVGNLHIEQREMKEAMEAFSQSMRIQVDEGITVDMHVVKNPLYQIQLSRHPHASSA